MTDRNLVFISYRRSDTGTTAREVFNYLVACLGTGRVFLDIKEIRTGAEWESEIKHHLDRSGAVVVLMGPNWLRSLHERAAMARRRLFLRTLFDPRAWAITLVLAVANVLLGLGIEFGVGLGLAALLTWLAAAYLVPGPFSRAIRSSSFDPEDQVRREIDRALELRLPLCPVLVNGLANVPLRTELPPDLRPLLDFNALAIPDRFFESGMATLCEDIKVALAPVVQSP